MKPSDKEILYPYVLEDKPRFLLGWVLYSLFRRAKSIENAMEGLKQLHKRHGSLCDKYRGTSILSITSTHEDRLP